MMKSFTLLQMEIPGQKFMVNENNLNMWYLTRY
jgi:hypothetical protein